MTFFRTVLGDLPAEQMGICYAHEHIIIEASFPTLQNPLFLLNDVDKVSAELQEVYRLGGRTMVDTMPANAGRNVIKLAEVSKRSGIQIIVPTGVHLEMYYPPNHWQFHYSEEELTQLFIDDVTVGVDAYDYGGPLVRRTPHRAGLIKLATGDDGITRHLEKIFRAVVNTHLETGVPILTHTNFGEYAIEQAERFEQLGADLRHVVISHVDRKKDVGYHRALLQSGVRVEYDSAFRWKAGEENWTLKLLEALLPDFPDQITVGMDAAKHHYWRSYGGQPGLTYLLTTFTEALTRRGLTPWIDRLFVQNPARLYAFAPAA